MLKPLSAVIALSLLVFAGPAQGQTEVEVPVIPNITDPVGDANYLNDQGYGDDIGAQGDNTTPADFGGASDIVSAWFTHTADEISVHIQTEDPGPATEAIYYIVRVDPGTGTNCLQFTGLAPGVGSLASLSNLTNTCGDGQASADADFVQSEGPDGTGITTITVARLANTAFVDGGVLKTPTAETRNSAFLVIGVPQIDNTKPGTDYEIKAPEPTASPTPTVPPKKKCKKNRQGRCKPRQNTRTTDATWHFSTFV